MVARAFICALLLTSALSLGAQPAATRSAGTRPNAARLAAVGLKVSWPLRHRRETVAPGTKITVRVRRIGRHAAFARLALVRTTRFGALRRRLVARALRKGRFTARIPDKFGAHYALILRAGDLTYRARIDTPAAAPPAPPAGSAPAPAAPSPWDCPTTGVPGADLSLSMATATAGQSVPYTLRNTGSVCLAGGGYRWQKLVDGAWVEQRMPPGTGFGGAARLIQPQTTWSSAAEAWSNLDPGHYRLVIDLYPWASTVPSPPPSVTVTAELDIVAPPTSP